MPSLDLARDPSDKSTYPLDFVCIYKNTHKFNFEYLSGSLQFYLIDNSDPSLEFELVERIKGLLK